MGISDRIDQAKVVENQDQVVEALIKEERRLPEGWQRGIQWDGSEGYVSSGLVDVAPGDGDWDQILDEFGMSPDDYMIHPDSIVQVRAWDANMGRDPETGEVCVRRMRYYRAPICLRNRWTFLSEEELKEGLKSWKPPKPKKATGEPHAFVINLADWQLGKMDGDGLDGTVNRIMSVVPAAKDRLRELRKLGIAIDTIVVMGLGDLIEKCRGHYPSQAFRTEINERQQFRIGVRLFRDIIQAMSSEAEMVLVGSVGGNHGENRNENNKAFTTPGDNADMAMVDMVSMALAEKGYENVKFFACEEEQWITANIKGTQITWTHGHINRKGATAELKQYNWWKDQAVHNIDLAATKVLVTGHYHAFRVAEHSQEAIWLQCPAMDGGSQWWENLKGERSTPGTLTFVVGPDTRLSVDHIKII